MKKKVFLAIPILIVILSMVLISFTQANNSGNCAIEIIDNGNTHLNVDDNTSLTKKIISSDVNSAVYQVKLNNTLKMASSIEMAMLIDTSRSMGINDSDRTMYGVVEQFVDDMFNSIKNIKISLSDTKVRKVGMTDKSGVNTIKTAITNLETTNSNSIDSGIDIAKATFSSSAQQKILVIFTDATDKITKVAELEEQGIQVITILTDMTRASYEVDGVSTVGLTYMMDSIDMDYIISMLSRRITDIVVTDVFSEDIIQYFDFEVVQKAENDTVETTDSGYIWKINQINANSSAELQFKLTLKDNIEIPEEKIYQNIQTSNKFTVEYLTYIQNKTYEVTDSPIIMICEKYNVEIQAVNADNTNLPIEGIEFEIIGKDSKGATIYNNILTTDEDGIINIEELKTTGIVTFTIKPTVNVSGYSATDTETIIINNDISKRELIVDSILENTVDNENRNISFKFPINTKKFTLEVNLTEENNSSVKIQGTQFRLIQPALNNKYEFSALYGETNSSGKLVFIPVVMPEKGTYDYILSQTSEHEGYETMGNVTIRITFDDNGNMTDIVAKHNKNVTAERRNNSYGIINVENKNLLTDVFDFELNLRDKDSTYPLQGALYTITVNTEEGEPITYSNQMTDVNGKINLVIQGSGFIQIKIKEELPVLGYKADLDTKEIIVYRSEGVVQYVVKTTPIDLDAVADSTNNKLIVNLQSESENDLSAVQVKLTDSQEYDVYIQDVKFTLTSIDEPVEQYTATTDENGIINFVIQGKAQGVYAYKLEIDNTTVPSIYKTIEEEMAVSVTFDENRRLIDISDAKGTFISFETDVVENEENNKIYHIGIAQVGLEMSDEATTTFEIKLTDNITNEPIAGAGYDITIKAGDIVRNKKGAKTNNQGIVTTKIITADIVELELCQVTSAVGYAIDTQVQTIKLEKVNDEYKIVDQGPYDLSDLQNGALIEENKLVFKHVNRKKNGSDIKLNLYINKMDKEENLVAGIPVRIYAPEIRNAEGLPLELVQYTDDFGYLELEKLIVPEIEIPGEESYILYIAEAERPVDSNEFVDKANTLIELKLTFRYNENKEIVELTNAEATKGNRLIKSRTFNGYETDENYESNLFLDIYTNYDEFGNFAMDFIKKDTEGEILNGAKYDVTIMRPNGTNLIRNDLEISDAVEFEGVFVTKGTTIEITEKEAPVGYELNQHTTIIKIVDVDIETLEVTAEIIDGNSGDTATVIEGVELIPLDDGTIKTALTVALVDKELNNFEMGIINTDRVTALGVKDVKYKVVSSKGFQVETPISNSEGKSDFKIGGRFTDETVSYEITQLQTGEFYKQLKDKITLNVVFDEQMQVDNEATLAAQTDPNYGIIWEIDSINVQGGNAVNIKIKNEPQDPLIVNVETLDTVTLNKIENVSYKISPSFNLSGEGVGTIEVGYVAPNKTKNYTISQITQINTHQTIIQQSINVVYDRDGNVAGEPRLSDGLELISYSEKTINVRIKLEPKVPFVLENVAYFDNSAIPNAQFEITLNGEKQSITTKTDGIDTAFIGQLGTNEEIIYHVSQIKAPIGYAYIDDFDIKVHYDANRTIDNVELVSENRFVEVSYVVPSTETDTGYNGNDKGIVKIRVKSYPELKMNIENIDALHGTKLAGTTYQVVSTINTKDDEVVTEANGIGVAHLDKTAINDIVEYTITETRPSALYQTMKEEVKIQVAFDDDGFIKSCEVIQGNAFATVSKIENITTPEENFILNVQIRSNKMLKINIVATDSQDDTYRFKNAGFSGMATFNNEVISTDNVITDADGLAMLKFDRCLESETIVYTIEQTKKNAGYQFPAENMQIEVIYDSNGKIIPDSVRLLQGSKYIQILNIDDQNFNIDVKIVNEETEEFGVEITAVDKYDDTIKLENIKYEAYLMTDKYAKDENYTGETTTDKNGEAYIQFNKYNAEYGETRVLRLVETNVPDTHRVIRASILVNINFDENGKIVGTTVPGGLNTYIGWVADGRFITVTHTNYTVIIQVHHYPYLNISLSTEDIYTGENLDGKYKISTTKGPGGYYSRADTEIMEEKIETVRQKIFQENKEIATLEDLISYLSTDTSVTKIKRSIDNATVDITINDSAVYTVNGDLQITAARGPWVSTGGIPTGYTNIDYIGMGYGEFLEAEFNTTLDEKYDVQKIGPTEQSKSRTFYIYELQEPNQKMQYQKYRPKYYTWYYSIIIGSITVNYDGKGNIESWTVGDLNSRNNIDYDFIEVNKLDNRNLEVKIKYAPATTMEVTAIDSVSREPLSNVRVYPYQNPTYNTRQSYEYRTISYYTTDANGKTNYTYWGANINEGQNEYKIDTSIMYSNGYYGTGRIDIKVSYDEYGRIAGADVMSVDENGMLNAEVVGFEDNKLKINILYYRKFNIQINKKDRYDSNINLSAQFKVDSDKGESKIVNSSKLTLMGIVRPGETVKYTLSETVVPDKYIPVENLEFYVTFDKDGSVKRAWSDGKLFESVYEREVVAKINAANVKDLEINIKNEPQVSFKIGVVDKFYNEKALEGVLFTIENNKGDVVTGNPTTNINGIINAIIGKVYPKETVEYTIRQISQVNGYVEKNLSIKLQVTFNQNGRIEDYKIISGNEYVSIDNNKFKNGRHIDLTIMLTPIDIKLGIKNYNDVTNEAIPNVTYKVTSQEIEGGSSLETTEIVTNVDGTVIDVIDQFKESVSARVVNYTISEINIPNTYRKIQDIVIQIRYGEDGRIVASNVLSNPSNVIVRIALGGRLQYLNGNDVHMLLEIPNNNSYDLIIKNEDKNYQNLGVEGTLYDITINGEVVSQTTDEDGTVKILNRMDSGNIQIRIAENTIGVGYKADNNNATILDIEKGTAEYTLVLNSNSNPTYADVSVSEEYGVITVIFKNETKSSITLVKDVNEVRYNVTSKEKQSDGTYTNEIVIGNDLADVIAQETLHYELGVTPQNKTIVYSFEEVNVPGDYHEIGTIEVTVQYDMYGHINRISDNSDRVDVIENPSGSHDIVVIVSEKNDIPTFGNGDGSITVVKDNKEVRYEISSKIVDEQGNYSNRKIIGSDAESAILDDQLFYKLTDLPKDNTMIFTIKEVSIPEGYTSNGIIEVTAKFNSDGLIYEITDNCENAEAKLIPRGRNNIAVVIAEEWGSLAVLKDDENVQYLISSKEDNGDGTYSNDKILREETEQSTRDPIYLSFREPIVNKTIIYTFKEKFVPEGYIAKESFEIKVEYNADGKIESIVNNYDYLRVEEDPLDSNDIFVYVLTDEANREAYTIKVVSQEVDTNLRINDSIFDIEINKGEGKLIDKVEGKATSNVERKGYILEKGVIKFGEIKDDGYIVVEANQRKLAEGYIYGKQKTSGTVVLNVEYQEVSGDNIKIPVISVMDNDGLEVTIDNTNREVIIKVYNEPEVIMEILTQFEEKNENGTINLQPQEEIHYTITSQIQTSTEILDTDLEVTAKETDEEGKTQTSVGRSYAGKTVIYTIRQEENISYDSVGDILILVQYDTKGLIKYYEVLTALDYVEIVGNEGERVISLQVTNRKQRYSDTYKIQLEKHHIDDEEYGKLIPGVKFNIHVKEEYGEELEWEAVTDKDGLIISKEFSGYGRIQIDITELEVAPGFKLDTNTYTIRVSRDKKTGKISIESSDEVAYEFSENYDAIIAKPVNEPRENSHTLVLNKTDLNLNTLITSSTAEFEVTRIEYENHGTEEEPNIVEIPMNLGTITTDEKGKARLENLDSPSEPGTYKYIIKEIKAPDGYLISDEEVVFNITFEQDEEGNIIIDKEATEILSGDAKTISIKENLLNIAVYNISEDSVIGENEYSLDITKVDYQTGQPIENMAIFKVWLPDENNTAVYTETTENSLGKGKLDYCYIEQDKDYRVRLTHMKLPEEDGILKYVFREVTPPEGYEKLEEDIELSIEFKTDEETGKMYIANAISSNPDYLKINTITPCPTDTRLEIQILNDVERQKEFTINYDANDNGEGTIVPNPQTKVAEIDIVLNPMIPEREGYEFKGWSAIPTAIIGEYQPGDVYSQDGDITLYAIWEERLYLNSTEYLIGTGVNPKDEWSPGQVSEYEEGDLYIKGIRPQAGIRYVEALGNQGTYLEELLSNLNTNADDIKVYIPEKDENGSIVLKDKNIVGNDRLIGTAMIIKLTKGEQEIQLTLIVRGDVITKNKTVGDGAITNTEGNRMKQLNAITWESDNYTLEEKQAIDYFIDTDIRWNQNKQAILTTYLDSELKPIR